MDINDMTIEQLETIIEHKKAHKRQQEKLARIEKVKKIVAIKDVLLPLMTHDRRSCTADGDNASYHPDHGVAECNKCCLEALTKYDSDIDVSISITLTRISNDR